MFNCSSEDSPMIRWISVTALFAALLACPLRIARAACEDVNAKDLKASGGKAWQIIKEVPFKDTGGGTGNAVLRATEGGGISMSCFTAPTAKSIACLWRIMFG